MRRLRPDDDFMLRLETEKTPQHIGALQFYGLGGGAPEDFYPAVRAHFEKRLPATPLLCRHRHAPLMYDSDVWLDVAHCDLDYHVEKVEIETPLSRTQVHAFVEKTAVQGIDLSRPPFKVYVLDRLEDGSAAIFMKIHHSVADGVGFQNIGAILTDPTPEPTYDTPARLRDERAPIAPLWLARSFLRFRREAKEQKALAGEKKKLRAVSKAFRDDPAHKRVSTPVLALSQTTSDQRRYTSLSLPLDKIKAAGAGLGGSVNHMFLALGAGAIRRYLMDIDDLPDQPLVAVAARSYRKPEHGLFGNRIITLNPAIHVEIADPVERFRAIQASADIEIQRSKLTEPLISEYDRPFGVKKRNEDYKKRTAEGQAVIQGNISLSNVPGPSTPVYLAGYEMLANYPTPILGSGRILNITLRRYRDHLDLGIMSDPGQLTDVEKLRQYLIDALDELEQAAASLNNGQSTNTTAE